MAVLASEKPRITMRDAFAQPPRRNRLQKPTHSSIIIGPPSSPDGFKLELVGNIPSTITPAERDTYLPQARDAHSKLEGKPGYFNPTKVNIVSARTTIKPDSDCIPHEVIEYVTAPSEYMYFRTIIDDQMPYETARHFTHAGANIVWKTGDGWLILGSRPDNNQYYPRTLEASASGGWDGQLDPKNPSLLIPPSKENAYHHVQKETFEELNIYTSNQTHLTVLGIGEEPTKKNWDILYYGQLPPRLSRATVTQIHNDKKQHDFDPNDPMAGHLTFIPATPRAIRHLLSRMSTPINPMAENVLLLTGYLLYLEQQRLRNVPKERAVRRAQHWKDITQRRMKRDRARIDFKIAAFRRAKIENRRLKLIKRLITKWYNPTTENDKKVQVALDSLRDMQATSSTYNIHLPPKKQMSIQLPWGKTIYSVPEVKGELERLGILPDTKRRDVIQRWNKRRNSQIFNW